MLACWDCADGFELTLDFDVWDEAEIPLKRVNECACVLCVRACVCVRMNVCVCVVCGIFLDLAVLKNEP